jgi:DNA-binding transcriptional ArsR family regulator
MVWRFILNDTDLGRIRFAFSPLWECIASLRVLCDPGLHVLHLPWIKEARANTTHLDLELLFVLLRDPNVSGNYIPDFLTPPPSTPFPDFRAELEAMCRTSHDIVMDDLRFNYRDLPDIPTFARPFFDTPQLALDSLAAQLELYWAASLESHWPRLRLLLEGDVMRRARQLALGGVDALFTELHPSLYFAGNALEKRLGLDPCDPSLTSYHPAGRGLVLVPSAFIGDKVMSMKNEPWQPTVIYPARGSADLWNAPLEPSRALEALLGDGCARVLEALCAPTGTLELAKRLRVAAGNVSHHLKRLTRAGLVESHRQGRIVYYRRSTRAEEILALYD